MKMLTAITLTLSLTLSQFAQADCYDMYKESLTRPLIDWDNSNNGGASHSHESDISSWELAGASAGATLIWAGFSAGSMLIVPAATLIGGAAVTDGVIALTNIKEKKMMKLIEESNNYVQSGGKSSPGKVLTRFKAKIKVDTDLYTLARHISKSNKNGNLCKENLPSFRKIAKEINKAVIVIDGSDI